MLLKMGLNAIFIKRDLINAFRQISMVDDNIFVIYQTLAAR